MPNAQVSVESVGCEGLAQIGGNLCPVGAQVEKCCHCHAQIEAVIEHRCFWCCEAMCWKCWEMGYGQCVKCARTIAAVPEVAKRSLEAPERKRGRKAKVRRCAVCRHPFSAREMRIHQRECKKAA